jgi:hypothetical protein
MAWPKVPFLILGEKSKNVLNHRGQRALRYTEKRYTTKKTNYIMLFLCDLIVLGGEQSSIL